MHRYDTMFCCSGHVDSSNIQPGYISFVGRRPELLKLMDDEFIKHNSYTSFMQYALSCIFEVAIVKRMDIGENTNNTPDETIKVKKHKSSQETKKIPVFDPDYVSTWENCPYATIVRFVPQEFHKYILMGEHVPDLMPKTVAEYRKTLSSMHYKLYQTAANLIALKESAAGSAEIQ